MPQTTRGKAILIGAGPGDPELLTLKAVRRLGEADVVLIDDLVNRDILQHTRPGARIIGVGKRGGCRSTPQAFIHRLMVRYAKQGKVVARLKGGDPYLFGRGGEEVAVLRDAGIETEVVNGITSGLAAASAIGVPLTHREATRGVTFVTGHSAEHPVNWPALAATGTTLVIYMGMSRLAEIVEGLHQGGLPARMPVAVIEHASLPQQRQLLTTLDQLLGDVAAHGLGSPAIIVVGEVVLQADVAVPALPLLASA